MFESLKHWLESLSVSGQHQGETRESLFNHPDDEALHIVLASLLYHIIAADDNESDKEKHLFSTILQSEFDVTKQQVAALYPYVKTLKTDISSDLNIINYYLKDKPILRMNLMTKLNKLMCLDGVNPKELAIFNKAMHVFFPEIKDQEDEF